MDLLVLGLLQKILSGSGNTVIDVIIDAILSETSENPVQNKVVTKALKNKADISHKHTAVEVGADSIGSAETALNDAKKYTDGKIADIINGAPSTLDTLSEIATAMDENKSVVDALDKAIGTKANKADIPTKTSELENDSNFLTEHQDLSSYAKTVDIPTELPANGGNADTVNNHTVNADVPSDAVFTDTVYTLPIATTEILGGVMPDGTTINVNENGVISTVGGSYTLPIATTEILGGVMPDGTTINVDENGVISTIDGSGRKYLVQYGYASVANRGSTIKFPKPFKSTPAVIATPIVADSSNGRFVGILSRSHSSFESLVYSYNNVTQSGKIIWIAIGMI